MALARSFSRSTLFAAVGGALLLGAVACQPAPAPASSKASAPAPTAPAPRIIKVQAHDYAFAAPETIQAGLVTIQLENHGQEPHHGQLARLNDGVTMERFLGALQNESEVAALALISLEGGPAAVAPHGTSEVTVDLKDGNYAFMCFIPSPDGVPHLAKGMIKPLQVTAPPAVAAAPVAEGTLVMKDFTFELPDSLPAGKHTYRVVNEGPQPHELAIVKLAPGKTVEDVKQFFLAPAGPPPHEEVGGINAFDLNGAGYMTLDLQPGSYAAICLVPEAHTGRPHVHFGMVKGFNVR